MGLKSAQNIREKKPLFIDIKILFFNRGKSVQKLKQKKNVFGDKYITLLVYCICLCCCGDVFLMALV